MMPFSSSRHPDRHWRSWGRLLATTVATTVALAACQETFPTAPSDLTEGIIVYKDANFRGESAHLLRSVSDLKDYEGPCVRFEASGGGFGTAPTTSTSFEWNDCISSITVAPGWRVRLYRDDDYSGQSCETGVDIANLQLVPGSCDHDGMNDCVTSLRLFAPDGRVALDLSANAVTASRFSRTRQRSS